MQYILFGDGARKVNYKYFVHKDCSFFPCHALVEEDWKSCLFCWCPLHHIEDCGGHWTPINGIKDCTHCTIPHEEFGYDYILDMIQKKVYK